MKTIWVKHGNLRKLYWGLGIALEDWGLPLSLSLFGGTGLSLTLLCFYVELEWGSSPDLADRMVEALKK